MIDAGGRIYIEEGGLTLGEVYEVIADLFAVRAGKDVSVGNFELGVDVEGTFGSVFAGQVSIYIEPAAEEAGLEEYLELASILVRGLRARGAVLALHIDFDEEVEARAIAGA